MIVLDANILIGFLDATDPHHEQVIDLIEWHAMEEFASPALTIAETLVHPTAAGLADAAAAALDRIGLQVLPLTGAEVAELARVRSQYGVRMPEAVVLAAAVAHRAALMTLDDRLALVAARAGVERATLDA